MCIGFEPIPAAPFDKVLSLQTFSLSTPGRRASRVHFTTCRIQLQFSSTVSKLASTVGISPHS